MLTSPTSGSLYSSARTVGTSAMHTKTINPATSRNPAPPLILLTLYKRLLGNVCSIDVNIFLAKFQLHFARGLAG